MGRTGFEPVTSSVVRVPPRRLGASTTEPLTCCLTLQDLRHRLSDSPAFTPLILAALVGHCRASLRAASNPGSSRWADRVRGRRRSFWTISPPSRPGAPSQRLCGDVRSQEYGCWARMAAPPGGSTGVLLLRRPGPRHGGGVEVAMVRRWSPDRCSGCTVEHPVLPRSAPAGWTGLPRIHTLALLGYLLVWPGTGGTAGLIPRKDWL